MSENAVRMGRKRLVLMGHNSAPIIFILKDTLCLFNREKSAKRCNNEKILFVESKLCMNPYFPNNINETILLVNLLYLGNV